MLWSTNTRIKAWINTRYLGDRHYVWCSPTFEAQAAARFAIGGSQPATSDPASIYRDLAAACLRNDDHHPKIVEQKTMLSGLAVQLHSDKIISDVYRDDILAVVQRSTPNDWKPVIYAIPYAGVSTRVIEVPRDRRASREPEYIIPDLRPGEFEMIEP